MDNTLPEHPVAPESLWRSTGPRIPTDDALPERTEVAVAGGGLAGLVVALELARRGHRVVVLEAGRVGSRTTGNTTGKLSLLQGMTFSGIRRHAGDLFLRAYLEANVAAQEWMRSELGDAEGAIETRTAFTYATTSVGDRALAAEAEAIGAAGLDVEVRGVAQIGLPFPVTSVLTLPGQQQLQPMIVLAVLTARLRALGGLVIDHCRVATVHNGVRGIELTTTRGALTARRFVLATGVPFLNRGMFFATSTPSRQFAAAYRLRDPDAVPAGMYLSVDPVTRSLRGARDAAGQPVLVVGGDSFVPGRDTDTRARLVRLDEWVAGEFPGANRVAWWAAQDYRMSTHVPFAGRMPRGGGRIYAATGFAKWGMTNAVAAALAIAGDIEAETPDWALQMRAHRLGLRDVGETVSANASVVRHFVSGWVAPGSVSAAANARVARRGLRLVAESTVAGVRCTLSAVCTHLGGVVAWNSAEQTWDCPLHGSRFSRRGRVIEGPATRDLAALE